MPWFPTETLGGKTLILNLLHRPETLENFHLFRWQQDLAHRVGLKVTIMLDGANLERPEVIAATLKDIRQFGDDVGIWLNPSSETRLAGVNNGGEEPFLWLQCEAEKRRLLESMHSSFISAFGFEPSCAGAYHLDQTSMTLLTEIMPQTKTVIAGCFEEGVRVFHGCNHSWYLFNEGMPWYPSKTHALKPAPSEDDWTGLVAVPHLIRDLVLSYEGRNDFFASHPQNAQRATANVGAEHPYDYNLLEQHRLQEDFNHGYSWVHVFVGPNWLSNNHNIEDSDVLKFPFTVMTPYYELLNLLSLVYCLKFFGIQ